jgi:glutamate dehydrogenase/leucine dehydrogenase
VGLAVAQVVARVVAGLANKPLAIKETVFSAKNGILCGEDEFAFLFYEKINVCTPF